MSKFKIAVMIQAAKGKRMIEFDWWGVSERIGDPGVIGTVVELRGYCVHLAKVIPLGPSGQVEKWG